MKTSLGSVFVAVVVVVEAADASVSCGRKRNHASLCSSQATTRQRSGKVASHTSRRSLKRTVSLRGSLRRWLRGGKPEDLPKVGAGLESAGVGLKETCELAITTNPASGGTKGVVEDVAKGAIEPVIVAVSSGLGALWKHHLDRDALELATKKTQLEAAKWPDFGDVVPAR